MPYFFIFISNLNFWIKITAIRLFHYFRINLDFILKKSFKNESPIRFMMLMNILETTKLKII